MRYLTPIVILLALAACIWFVLGGDQEEPRTETDSNAPSDAGLVAEADPVHQATTEDVEPEIERLGDPTDSATGLQVLDAPQFEGDGLILHAIQYDTHAPIPDALVLVGPERRTVPITEGLEDFLIEHGEVYRADAEGILHIPASWAQRWIGIRGDGLWGSMRLEQPRHGNQVVIKASPDRALQVKVEDGQGLAMEGVRVGLFGSPYGNILLLRAATTDAQGIASLELANDPALRDRGNLIFWVDTVAPKADPPTMTYPLAEMPQRILLQIQGPASLSVQLRGVGDTPLRSPVELTLIRADAEGKPASRPDPSSKLTLTSDADGKVQFLGLEPGVPMVLQVAFLAEGKTEDQLLAPFEPSEDRDLIVEQQAEATILRFKLVDAFGNALATIPVEASLTAVIADQPSFPQGSTRSTDAEGYLDFPLDDGSLDREGFAILERTLELRWADPERQQESHGKVDLQRVFEPGIHDLGDVVMESAPVLVAGQVLDEHGMPHARARVRVRQAAVTQEMRDGEVVINTAAPRRIGAEVYTDADGHFRIHGIVGEGDLEVVALDRHGNRVTQEFLAGDQAVHLVLERGSILAGRILLPEELQAKGATLVFLFPASWNPEDEEWKMLTTDAYGYFYRGGFDGSPGRAAVVLGGGYPKEHLLEFDQVQPWKPGTPGDPRLEEIDLRNAFRSFHVRAIDAAGDSITSAQFIQERKTESGRSWSTFDSLDGSYTFHGLEPEMAITIKAVGFHPKDVVLDDPEMEIELEQAASGTFLVNHLPKLPANHEIVLDLDPIGFDIGGFRMEPDVFDPSGKLETFLPPPGRYHVNLSLRVRSMGGWSSTDHIVEDVAGNRLVLEIDEKGEAPTFAIELAEDFYDQWPALRRDDAEEE